MAKSPLNVSFPIAGDFFSDESKFLLCLNLHNTRHVAIIEKDRSACKILIGIPTGNRPLGRPRRTWEENIRKDLQKIGIITRNWAESSQDRDYWRSLVNAALNHGMDRSGICPILNELWLNR